MKLFDSDYPPIPWLKQADWHDGKWLATWRQYSVGPQDSWLGALRGVIVFRLFYRWSQNWIIYPRWYDILYGF